MKDLNKLRILISKPEHFEYFFKKVDDPDLFDWLENEIGVFDHIPETILSEDGKSRRFLPWWPGVYLIKMANKVPDKVLRVLKKIKTNNSSALYDAAQAILNMPSDFLLKNSKEINYLFLNWLNTKYSGFLLQECAGSLFKKYIGLGSPQNALNLLSILSRPIFKKSDKSEKNIEFFRYKELLNNEIPKLMEEAPKEVIEAMEANLRSILEREYKGKKSDFSEIWRPSIEDSDQNWRHEDLKDMFVQTLRDSMEILYKNLPNDALDIVGRWINDKFSIFQRLAIHCIRLSNGNINLAKEIIMDRNRIFSGKPGYHEFLLLLRDKFMEIDEEDKIKFLKLVEKGPLEDKYEHFEDYKKREQLRILLIIKDSIEESARSNMEFSHYLELIDKLKNEKTALEHLTFTSPHVSWVGPASSLSKDEITKMSPDQFISWIKTNLQAPFEIMGPSPEGVSRIFQEVVKEKYMEYANAANKFLDNKVWPTYLCGYIRGLGGAIEEGKSFNLEPVLRFIENPLKFSEEPKIESRHDRFDVGQYSWFRGAIYNFLEALVSHDKIRLDEDIMNRTRILLLNSIRKEEDPTEADEKKYGSDAQNMDYVTYCINSNRGQALHAIIQHALRFARMQSKKKEIGPFPPGERMYLYKEFLTKYLDEEKSPSVQSSYGQFLPNLFYLDQEWVKQMKRSGKLFPRNEEKNKIWEAHWQGYLFSNFYDQIYKLLKEDYEKAVVELVRPNDNKRNYRKDEALTVHLMSAFWRKLEDFDEKRGVLNTFFQSASVELRSNAIRLLGDAIKAEKPSRESEEWSRLKALWKDRLKKSKDAELGNFVTWLKYCPDVLDSIVDLIVPIVPYLYMGYQEENLLVYINDNIEINTKNALQLLIELFKVKESLVNIHFRLDLIKEILIRAKKCKDIQGVSKYINQIVNRLGEVGYYDFKDLLKNEGDIK